MNASGLSSEQVKLQARTRELAKGPVAKRAAEVDRTEQYPWDNVTLLKDAKLLGMTIPTAYGGQGRGWLDAVLVIEALSAACSVTGRRNRPSSSMRRIFGSSSRAHPTNPGSPNVLHLFVFTQSRTQNRFPLLLGLL